MTTHRYLIALGTNMGERELHLQQAIALLGKKLGMVLAVSPIWETEPVGPADHLFLNAALTCTSPFAPEDAMAMLLEIEATMGRERREKWGNRLIDLDLLLGMDREGRPLTCQTPLLQLPHPLMLTRTFVLQPAVAIAGDWIHPLTGASLQDALEKQLHRERSHPDPRSFTETIPSDPSRSAHV